MTIHWMQLFVGYLIGSFFGIMSLMNWAKGISGAKTSK